jgi:hypothetical protein
MGVGANNFQFGSVREDRPQLGDERLRVVAGDEAAAAAA